MKKGIEALDLILIGNGEITYKKYVDQNKDGVIEFSRQVNELYIPVALALSVEKFTEILLDGTGIVPLFKENIGETMYALIVFSFL